MRNQAHSENVINTFKALHGVNLINVPDHTFLKHIRGKIGMKPKMPIKNRDDLPHVYTPGVARVCTTIHEDKGKTFSLTIKRSTVAVLSEWAAVSGLGNIGARGYRGGHGRESGVIQTSGGH